ncbi:MAG: ArsR family transcriptional regulator, partial [Thermodesulfobacteriales bacterium]
NLSSNPNPPELSDLFFELSNEDRLDIIKLIDKNPKKLSLISKELDLPVQEISRQLNRLVKVKLVTKNGDGAYQVTLMGLNLLGLLPGYQFLAEHFDYFNNYSLLTLPRNFKGRIGELFHCSLVPSVLVSFANIEKMIQEAEEYILSMADQRILSPQAYFLANEALMRGVEMKIIEPWGYSAPSEVYDNVPVEVSTSIRDHRIRGVKQDKVLPNVKLSLFMNEKEVALLAFPNIKGEFDYTGFTSTDEAFIEFCLELHQFYWK